MIQPIICTKKSTFYLNAVRQYFFDALIGFSRKHSIKPGENTAIFSVAIKFDEVFHESIFIEFALVFSQIGKQQGLKKEQFQFFIVRVFR